MSGPVHVLVSAVPAVVPSGGEAGVGTVAEAAAIAQGALLLPLAIVLPAIVSMIAFAVGERRAPRIVLLATPLLVAVALGIVAMLLRRGAGIAVAVGDWAPPLGIVLRADGLGTLMLVATALIATAIALAARLGADARSAPSAGPAAPSFWTLLPAAWSGLACVFLAGDLFTLFVALELLTFAAVPLVCLDGRRESHRAALRYLLFALLGSLLYLLGTALIYGSYGTLDLGLLGARIAAGEVAEGLRVGAALMLAGMLAKTALFPFHFWLPPAHAAAPAAASALLSALVVKGSFFVALRIWLDLLGPVAPVSAGQFLALLGALAILFGSAMALRQRRLKPLVAYSTVAQIGYLFVVFPILASPALRGEGAAELATAALAGGMLQTVSHAFAKAAMFLAAGSIALAMGDDRIERLAGAGRAVPVALAAFAVGGLSLVGLPPSGGFWAKWLLVGGAIASGQWWWALVMLAGGLLAAGYLYRVIAAASAPSEAEAFRPQSAPRGPQIVALALAIASLLLALMALAPLRLVEIGRVAAHGGIAP